jgi:hypothetical protein
LQPRSRAKSNAKEKGKVHLPPLEITDPVLETPMPGHEMPIRRENPFLTARRGMKSTFPAHRKTLPRRIYAMHNHQWGRSKSTGRREERNNATEHSFDQRLPGFRLMNGSAVGRFGNETAPCNTTALAITSTQVKHRVTTHPRCIRRPIGPTPRTPRRPGVWWRGPGLLLRRRSSRRRSQA